VAVAGWFVMAETQKANSAGIVKNVSVSVYVRVFLPGVIVNGSGLSVGSVRGTVFVN
jgi:hypothetical protein